MPGPKSDKIWSDAVRRAVLRRIENEEGKPQKIERLADNLVDMALGGDMPAIKEIGERLDGKAPQGMHLSNGDGEALFPAVIEHVIVNAPKAED